MTIIQNLFKKSYPLLSTPLLGIKRYFHRFDQKVDQGITFFFKHYGKTKFMVAMSKKVQYLGIEKLFLKSPKAFFYFFMFYLIRDTILYIIIPIYFASLTN